MIFQPFIDFATENLTIVLNWVNANGTIAFPDNIFQAFMSLFGYLGWFFPIAKLLPILLFTLGLYSFRATIALIRFIKGFIPTMGG